MEYLILARKYRPQKFDEVIGQEHITAILKNSLSQHRLTQAYLFAGPRGVGKTSMARILAKSLNCINGPTLNPCEKCSNCLEISEGRSLDCLEIDGASNRGIDEIRALRENIKFSPSSAKFKIYIIDEVHMLTQEAFNALLKTLEEPPPHVKFIFATTQPQKVIPTILSRCQRFDFRNLPTLKIMEKLQTITKLEKIDISKEALFAISKEANGSLRDAESILDQVASLSKKMVSLEDVNNLLGTLEYDFLFNITNKIIANDAEGLLKLINDFTQQGRETTLIFSNLLEHIRNLTLSKFFKNAQQSYLDLPLDIKEQLIQQAKALSLKRLLNMFEITLKYQEQANRSDFPQIILELMAVKLTLNYSNENNTQSNHIISNPQPFKNTTITPTVATTNNFSNKRHEDEAKDTPSMNTTNEMKNAQTVATLKTEDKTIELETVKEKWPLIIEELSKIKMSLSAYLKEATLIAVEANTLKLGYPKRLSFHKEVLEHKNNCALLEKIMNDYLGCQLKIKFEIIQEIESTQNNNYAKDLDSDAIRSALDVFKGKIVN